MKFPIFLFAALLFSQKTFSQTEQPRVAEFTTSQEGNGVRFKAQLPPLDPIPGAPPPFVTCHWEFGDGNYSTELNPLYRYNKPGNHPVYLATTASYDGGKPPKNGKGIVGSTGSSLVANASGAGFNHVFTENTRAIALDNNHDARAEEQMVVILSYRNTTTAAIGGEIHLFFNEKSYKERHFGFEEARTHFGETDMNLGLSFTDFSLFDYGLTRSIVPNLVKPAQNYPIENGDELLEKARDIYSSEHGWRFDKIAPGEKRNIFVTLVGTPDMLRDTSATITVRGVFLPTNPSVPAQEFILEIPVVASHDPNLIAVSDKKVNFRHIKRRTLGYKVRFQNNGEGPAKKIELTVDIPKGLNMGKMRPLEWYPKCPICPDDFLTKDPKKACLDTAMTKKGLVFTFHNIYLPGSRQLGLTDRDSTKGFVKYRIEPKKNMPKRGFRSRAHIVFDKNPPVTTNFSKTKFKVGLSPGIKFGYLFEPDSPKNGSYFGGLSFSPYKSWRAYPQIEVLVGRGGTVVSDGSTQVFLMEGNPDLDFKNDTMTTIFNGKTVETTGFFEVPVLIRKNFSRFFGLGIGASARYSVEKETTKTTTDTKYLTYLAEVIGGVKTFVLTDTKILPTEVVSESSNQRKTRFSVFADLTIGAVRAGPNIGLRMGGVLGNGFQPFGQLSAEWKF